MTGIESWIVEKANWRLNEVLEKKNEEFNYPYDLGKSANFWQVFGRPDEKVNGFDYPVKEDCHKYSLTIEQLLQKKIKEERSVPFKCVKPYR